MTEVKINTNALELEVSGHAGSGELGKDIVCAAVSALAFTLGMALEEKYNQGLVEEMNFKTGNGYLNIKCKSFEEYRERAEDLFEAFAIGFDALALKYPGHIKILPMNQEAIDV